MRAGAGVDDGMPVDDLELGGVVPSASKLRAAVVVLGVDGPQGPLVRIAVEHDHHHLPVGLVVVRAVVAAAPVVERVEEPVLEHGPTGLANDAPVVRVGRRLTDDLPIARDGIAGQGSRDPTSQEQAQREEGVHETREIADPAETARAAAELRLPIATREDGRRKLARHAEELAADGRLGNRCRETIERELARGDDLDDLAVLAPDHERGARDEVADVHREEVLPQGVAHDRLVAAEELEIVRHRALPG